MENNSNMSSSFSPDEADTKFADVKAKIASWSQRLIFRSVDSSNSHSNDSTRRRSCLLHQSSAESACPYRVRTYSYPAVGSISVRPIEEVEEREDLEENDLKTRSDDFASPDTASVNTARDRKQHCSSSRLQDTGKTQSCEARSISPSGAFIRRRRTIGVLREEDIYPVSAEKSTGGMDTDTTEAPVIPMSQVNQMRTNRLANALKAKNDSVPNRSQSVRYHNRPRPTVGSHRGSDAGRMDADSDKHLLNPATAHNDMDDDGEFRRRTNSVPSHEQPMRRSSNSSNQKIDMLKPQGDDSAGEHIAQAEEETGGSGAVHQRMRTFTIDPAKGAATNAGGTFRRRASTLKVMGGQPETLAVSRMGMTAPPSPSAIGSKNSSSYSSRSHSPSPYEPLSPVGAKGHPEEHGGQVIQKFHIVVLGLQDVGKSSLINQFMTSEYCINPFQNENSAVELTDDEFNTVLVSLDGHESQITFIEVDNEKNDMWLSLSAAGYLVVYSVDDLASFRNAETILYQLRQRAHTMEKPIILVGNKIDLERKRMVASDDGKKVAKENDCKFLEIAVANGHHVNDLLVGLLTKVRQNKPHSLVLKRNSIPLPHTIDDLTAAAVGSPTRMTECGFLSSPSSGSASGSNDVNNNSNTSKNIFRFGTIRRRTQSSARRRAENDHEACEKGVKRASFRRHEDEEKKPNGSIPHMPTACGIVGKIFGRYKRRDSRSLEDLMALESK